jgi:uncharacterized surface anchored protein
MKTTFIVKDSWGKPLAGATVRILDAWDTQILAEKTTDANGKVEIEMPSGVYHVIASKAGYQPSYPTFWLFDKPEYTFMLSEATVEAKKATPEQISKQIVKTLKPEATDVSETKVATQAPPTPQKKEEKVEDPIEALFKILWGMWQDFLALFHQAGG